MRKLYHDSLLVFLRSKNLSVPYFILLALILLHLGFCYHNYLVYNDIFSVTIWLVRPNIFLIAFFLYFSYELTVKIYDYDMVEYLKIYPGVVQNVYGTIILSLLTIVAVPSIMFLAFILFMYSYSEIQYLPFLVHLIKLFVLYFGIAFLIGIMLGTALAAKLKTNRLAVYSLTVVFILLNTTFVEVPFRIPYLLFNSYTTERMLYYIKDFFTVVPHELGSHFDIIPIYGFPLELVRWILAVFWVVFPLTFILTEGFNRKANKTMLAASGLIALLGVGLFSVRGSTLIMDMRVDSFPYADPIYYMDRPAEDYSGCEAGFSIEEYKMDLTISNELHAEVEVTIDSLSLNSYDFTLYHGYVLQSVRTEEDEEIPFTRQGDYISIGSLDGEDKLIFKYYGKSPKFYANKQAITLPGYFAYYPQAGRKNIWDLDRYGYVINTSPNDIYYTVNVHSNLEVFSNLAGGNNSFHGRSNGLSLFAGMYDEVANNIYAEPMRREVPRRECLREAEQILTDVFNRLERPGRELINIADKKMFQVPRSFGLNSNTDAVVIMNDHITSILFNNGQELALAIMDSILKPKADSRFRMEYLNYLFNKQDESDPIFQSAVDLNLLLQQIEERKFLAEKYQNLSREKLQTMKGQEREAYLADQRQMIDLGEMISEKAAKYLFYDSPRKEENLRLFFDYLTSDSSEEYMGLVENIAREELEDDYS